jgi:mediator of RNA polymerase II transcription subunit 14
VRLSLEEFDKMPLPFRQYTVHSGRATFKVEGEFEVDLTVADEDFESQFWFIDFRILFTPAPEEVPEYIRNFLEGKVNGALKDGGLASCYTLLHEFILTLKITEMYDQALAMSRGRWIETLKVERLNRYMSFQYWANRYPTAGPQSWVIVGTKSGDEDSPLREFRSPSSIYLRWFRDAKEVKDFDIPFDVEHISVEDLLKVVVARHVEHTLTSIRDKLLSKPRFANKQASLTLRVSKEDSTKTSLTLPLFDDKTISVSIDPTAGYFLLSPPSPIMQEAQRKLNATLNLPDEIPAVLEKLRCTLTAQEINHRSRTSGWSLSRSPIPNDRLKEMISPSSREPYQATWLRHRRLPAEFHVMLSMSLAGDRWWLIQV